MDQADKVRENRLRRMAERLGFGIRKSRARKVHVNDLGGYQIVQGARSTVALGERFECTLDDVEAFLNERESSVLSSRPSR